METNDIFKLDTFYKPVKPDKLIKTIEALSTCEYRFVMSKLIM